MHKSMQIVRIFKDVKGSWQEKFILAQLSFNSHIQCLT